MNHNTKISFLKSWFKMPLKGLDTFWFNQSKSSRNSPWSLIKTFFQVYKNCNLLFFQRIAKGYIARKRFLKIRRGVIRLQALFRGFSVRKKLRKIKHSAKTIQCSFRNHKKMQQERQNFLQMRKASETIQNEWRRFKFRQGIEWFYIKPSI